MEISSGLIAWFKKLLSRYIICIEICWFACFKIIAISEEAECKGPVSYGELYNKVHKRKNGQYVSNRAKDFIVSIYILSVRLNFVNLLLS